MSRGLLGKKVGMTQVFDQKGDLIPVTVLELGPNPIIQVKSKAGKDGYNALKVGYGPVRLSKLNRPELGVFKNAAVNPCRHVREFRVHEEHIAQYNVGEQLTVGMLFMAGENVDVTGVSKGRGYQGVVKRHGFKGAKERTHGTHEYKRHPGAIGCSADPARVIKGKKLPGQMGNNRVTVRALRVVAIYPEQNLLLVKGAVPGPNGGVVETVVSAKQPAFLG